MNLRVGAVEVVGGRGRLPSESELAERLRESEVEAVAFRELCPRPEPLPVDWPRQARNFGIDLDKLLAAGVGPARVAHLYRMAQFLSLSVPVSYRSSEGRFLLSYVVSRGGTYRHVVRHSIPATWRGVWGWWTGASADSEEK